MIKDFKLWLVESQLNNDSISKLRSVKYLHKEGEIDTDEYLKVAIPILKMLGKIPSQVEVNTNVEDQDDPDPNYWSDWANSWRGKNGEQIVSIVGSIDWSGAGHFEVELNTGLKCKISLAQREITADGLGAYEMNLQVLAGDRKFTSTTDDLMKSDREWSGSEELIGYILDWVSTKYGHRSIDYLADSIDL